MYSSISAILSHAFCFKCPVIPNFNMVNTGTQWFMAQRKASVFVEKVIILNILNIYLIFFVDESKGIIYE